MMKHKGIIRQKSEEFDEWRYLVFIINGKEFDLSFRRDARKALNLMYELGKKDRESEDKHGWVTIY